MGQQVPAGTAYRDKKRHGWVAELRWPARGIRRRWRGVTKREAVAEMEAYRKALGAGLRPEEVTFDVLADQYVADLERTARPSTMVYVRNALRHARPVIGHVLVADIVPSHVMGVLHAAEDAGLGPRSVKAVRGQVWAVMQRAVNDRLITGNPVNGVKGPKQATTRLVLPPIEDVTSLLDQMRASGHPSWPMLWVIASAGLRTGEARGLRWSDIDRQGGVLHVRGQLDRGAEWVEPKTSSGTRAVPLTPRMVAAVDEMGRRQAEAKVRSLYLFANASGDVPAPWSAHRAWTRAQTRAWGTVKLTTHGLRHLMLSTLVAQGLSLTDVAEVAGHADIKVLAEVYAHALSGHQDRVRKALESSVG